jgi:hypothetical protein
MRHAVASTNLFVCCAAIYIICHSQYAQWACINAVGEISPDQLEQLKSQSVE